MGQFYFKKPLIKPLCIHDRFLVHPIIHHEAHEEHEGFKEQSSLNRLLTLRYFLALK